MERRKVLKTQNIEETRIWRRKTLKTQACYRDNESALCVELAASKLRVHWRGVTEEQRMRCGQVMHIDIRESWDDKRVGYELTSVACTTLVRWGHTRVAVWENCGSVRRRGASSGVSAAGTCTRRWSGVSVTARGCEGSPRIQTAVWVEMDGDERDETG